MVNKSDNQLPKYATSNSAGFDIRAAEEKIILPGETQVIGTGLYFELPQNWELQIRSRSGLASKGIIVANSPGTIDPDYRGEIKILLRNNRNFSNEKGIVADNSVFQVHKGDRIAQGVLAPFSQAHFQPVEQLGETKRGDDGIGSTGIQ